MKLLRDKVLYMAKELRESEKATEAAQCPGTGAESSEVNTYLTSICASGLASVGNDTVQNTTLGNHGTACLFRCLFLAEQP